MFWPLKKVPLKCLGFSWNVLESLGVFQKPLGVIWTLFKSFESLRSLSESLLESL